MASLGSGQSYSSPLDSNSERDPGGIFKMSRSLASSSEGNLVSVPVSPQVIPEWILGTHTPILLESLLDSLLCLSSSLLFVCCDKQVRTAYWRHSLFQLTLPHLGPSLRVGGAGTQGRNLKQRPWWTAAYGPPLWLSSVFSHSPGPPACGWAPHSELGPLTSLSNQDSFSEIWPWANLMEANIQLKFPLV